MKLFKKLAKIYSGSNNEEPMRKYIRRWIKSSIPEATVSEDKFGNLYIVKGESETYPCVVAHLDQVQDKYPEDLKIVETSHIIFSYSPSKRDQCGLGADDKCGIWIALKMLKKHDCIKVAFFPGEEIGCQGSGKADLSFFDNVRFVVEPDRRGANDLITQIGWSDICSKEFEEAINYGEFGYKPTTGLMTDVEELKNRGLKVSCINLSCGYYDPHTDHEYVVKEDMINALNFVDNIIENCTEVYVHEQEYNFDYRLGCYDDWYGYDYYGYSRKHSKKKEKTNTDTKRKTFTDDEYWEEYEIVSQWVEEELFYNPHITPEEFYTQYSDLMDILEIDTIKEMSQYFHEAALEKEIKENQMLIG